MKRTITLLLGAALGALWLAAPAHATPVPAPSPSPTPTTSTPTDPCVLPSPTLEELPQAELPSLRHLPRLPLPRACFVTVKDLCEGESEVTLKNPIPNVIINYQVAGEDFTRGVLPGHELVVPVSSSLSPWSVWIVLDDEGSHKFLVTRHRYHEPKDCQSPSPSPTPVVTSEAPEVPQLPVTGQDVGTQMAIGAAAGGLGLLLAGGLGVVLWRRRRSAA